VFPVEYHVDESFRFHPVERLPLEIVRALLTATFGWLLVAIAVGPAVGCAFALQAPVSVLEFAVSMASCAWPLAVFWLVQRRAKTIVQAET
jgi:hypothetical protein